MNVYLKNNGDCYMLCQQGTAEAVAVPPGDVRPFSLCGDSFTVSLPHSWGCDELGIHMTLESTYTFAGLQAGDTVELFREKTAVATVKGVQGHIWYDRGIALCRVAEAVGVTYAVSEAPALQEMLQKQYHAELRWSLLWQSLLDVSFDLLMELGGSLVLFVFLWIAVGFRQALLFAGGVMLLGLVLTVLINLLMEFPRLRRQYRQIIVHLAPDTIAAYYAGNTR